MDVKQEPRGQQPLGLLAVRRRRGQVLHRVQGRRGAVDVSATSLSPNGVPRMASPAQPAHTFGSVMRARALSITAGELKVPVDRGEAVLGVVTDWALREGVVATAVCFVTGDASLYLPGGGGVIGGVGHQAVRQAADRACRIASRLTSHFQPTVDHPLPPAGKMRFAVLTTVRAYAATASCEALASQSHPLAPIGNAVQALITRIREASEKRSTPSPRTDGL